MDSASTSLFNDGDIIISFKGGENVVPMGESHYRKHGYFFPWPYVNREIMKFYYLAMEKSWKSHGI